MSPYIALSILQGTLHVLSDFILTSLCEDTIKQLEPQEANNICSYIASKERN